MLKNRRDHRKVEELETTAAQRQTEIRALTASLTEQVSQIQKVARLRRVELSKPAPQMVGNNQ